MTLLLLIALLNPWIGPDDGLSQRIQAAAETHLASTYPELARRVEVRVTRVSVETTADELRITLPKPGVPRAHTKVDVLEQAGGNWERAGWAMVYVSHFDSVAVAVRDVPRDEEVELIDVAPAWVETTRFHGEPLTMARLRDLHGGDGLIAARPLRTGAPLKMSDVRAPWAVVTGQAVTMQYERNGIFLEIHGRSRETGALDDEIRIYSQDTGTTYRARIVGPGQVHWLETL